MFAWASLGQRAGLVPTQLRLLASSATGLMRPSAASPRLFSALTTRSTLSRPATLPNFSFRPITYLRPSNTLWPTRNLPSPHHRVPTPSTTTTAATTAMFSPLAFSVRGGCGLKTHKGAAKRMRVKPSGAIKRWKAGLEHLNTKKSGKRIRQGRQTLYLNHVQEKTAQKMLPHH
eukprot:comp11823_c0_seq1/m.6447 comp11823_c0_seq1/g.6447  ORF comp11823_c0_seq1/g.6447 comp11823_c0_seq1/m.6447 type:complete len:174 (-) comp11823_c0_seq1:43-564(-)